VVHDGREVVGQRVEVVSIAGLIGVPAAAAVEGDAAQSFVDEARGAGTPTCRS